MKKILFIMLALAAILPVKADNYLTFGVNDTLMVRPSREDGTQHVMVRAHFEGRLNQWILTLHLPQGVTLAACSPSDDMLYVPYWNSLGERSYYSAPLFVNKTDDVTTVDLVSNIYGAGYWDPNNDGIFETYGTIKWEAGDYERMCELVFKFEVFFPSGSNRLSPDLRHRHLRRSGERHRHKS